MTTDTPIAAPPVEDLMQPLKFDQEDLEANRAGHLSADQAMRLQGMQRRTIIITLTLFFVLSLLATAFFYFASLATLFTLAGMLTTILNAIMVGMNARYFMRLRADLVREEIDILEGNLERIIQPNRRVANYVVRIAGEEFAVSKDLFQRFGHDVPYQFYRTAYSHILLAAEPL